ncbi:hypothetical protein [Aliarcobacter butzleri]|uniref:hypothetical protein n=1 Tax=Aliarcobacter butzleri TaxID=28197 RepID=UPI0021B31F79|nr:hypothetical protein [Aliarcobacter butzleri]MCT7618538.1 hypothetical protein [Aliarcobacter butzleri]
MTESEENAKLILDKLLTIKLDIINFAKIMGNNKIYAEMSYEIGIRNIILLEKILAYYPNRFHTYPDEKNFTIRHNFKIFVNNFHDIKNEIDNMYKQLPFINTAKFENLIVQLNLTINRIIKLSNIPENEIELIYQTIQNIEEINEINNFDTEVKVKEKNIDELESEIKRLQEQINSNNSKELKEELQKKEEKLNQAIKEKNLLEKKAKEYDEYLNETEKINQAINKLKEPADELIESKKIFERNRDNYDDYAMQLFTIAKVFFILIILNLFFFVGINDIAKSEKGINLSFYLINVFPILFPTILGFLFIRQSNINSQEVQKINRRFILIHEVNQSLQALVEVNRGKKMDNKTEKVINKLIENILNYATESSNINNNQETNLFGLNESIDKLIDTIDKKLTVIGKTD